MTALEWLWLLGHTRAGLLPLWCCHAYLAKSATDWIFGWHIHGRLWPEEQCYSTFGSTCIRSALAEPSDPNKRQLQLAAILSSDDKTKQQPEQLTVSEVTWIIAQS